MENNQGNIEDIFREAFANHEMSVSAKVWTGVQASMGAQAAASSAAVGASATFMKAASVVGISSIVAIGTVNEVTLYNETAAVDNAVEIMDVPQTEPAEEQSYVVSEETWSSEDQNTAASEEKTEIVSSKANEEMDVAETKVDKMPPQTSLKTESIQSVEDKAVDVSNQMASTPDPAENPSNSIPTNTVAEDKSPVAEKDEPKVTVNPPAQEVEETPAVCSINLDHDAMAWISPDGDNTNDCFSINPPENLTAFEIRIWTRNRELLFESSDPNFEWCGQDKSGKLVPSATMCYYQIIALDENNIQYTKRNAKGSIKVQW